VAAAVAIAVAVGAVESAGFTVVVEFADFCEHPPSEKTTAIKRIMPTIPVFLICFIQLLLFLSPMA
jgi:hypothetical protein